VNEKEIELLYHRFQTIDRQNLGQIGPEDLFSIPEVAMNPLSRVLFEYIFHIRSQNYDKEYSLSSDLPVKMLDFPDFVAFMAIFHPQTPLADKFECNFKTVCFI